jgi:glutamate/aspartate transport system substrate-binding protein
LPDLLCTASHGAFTDVRGAARHAGAVTTLRGDADFRLAVDRVLAQIYRTGEIEAIYNSWLLPLGKPGIPLMTMYLLNGLPE